MAITSYSADELYDSIESKDDVIYLDVRNQENHRRFMVEGPNDVEMYNIPYFDFMEDPAGCTAKLPEGRPVKVICAQEGSAQFVADILDSQGREEISWLEGGIVTWGNLLIPKRINSADEDYEIWQFNRPGKASCSYGLIHGEEMMLFDASRAVEFYVEFAASRGADIRHVLETHLQADYISGSPRIAAATGAEFHAHDGDYAVSVFDYTSIVDGELIQFKRDGGPSVLCTHAPGHTPGSTAYVVDEKYLISGDTVFIVSV
ncbi:MAG: MBL fold metallo-hydrolase, partial [Candidatus Poseidoniia archaeon]